MLVVSMCRSNPSHMSCNRMEVPGQAVFRNHVAWQGIPCHMVSLYGISRHVNFGKCSIRHVGSGVDINIVSPCELFRHHHEYECHKDQSRSALPDLSAFQEHTALFLRWQEPIEGKLAFVNSTGSVEVGVTSNTRRAKIPGISEPCRSLSASTTT